MNWKTLLPVAVLLVAFTPTGAVARNHHILDGLSPSSGISSAGSALSGGTSLLGHGSSLTSGIASGLTSTAAPVASVFTGGMTGQSGLFKSNSGLLGNNSGLLNNNGLFHRKHRRNLLSRLLSQLGFGRFQNGRFNNNGSVFGNSNSSIFRGMLGNRSF